MPNYTPYPPQAWDPDFQVLVDQETYFVTQTWARLVKLDPPPPDSAGECADVATAVKSCDEARKQSIEEQDGSWLNVVWPLVRLLPGSGGIAKPEDLKAVWPGVWEMLHAALWDLQPGLYQLKTHFMRGRPTHQCGVKPWIKLPGHPAYPGGHAAQAHAAAELLGRLFAGPNDDPQLRQALKDAAAEVALNRIVAGIHYPSDSEAGRLLALQFAQLLVANAMFRELMVVAAKDLKLKP